MKNANFLIIAFVAISFTLFNTSCTKPEQNQTEDDVSVATTPGDIIKQGEYLVGIMGCNDCHSPKRMGPNGPELIPELMLSGYPSDRPLVEFTDPLLKQGFATFYPDLTAAAGPWGITFAANITPDETGIGNWTEEQFKKALTQGKYKGLDDGRMLLPPMPWVNYMNMTDEDLNAVFMYLKSVPAVSNTIPAPISPDEPSMSK